MNNICVFIPYFGRLPNTFQYWLNSCKYNKFIDFYLYTDDTTEYDYPNNVKVIYTTLEEIKKIVVNKLNMEVWLERPYKLCDFKPAYAYIFDNIVSHYTHWGYCDVDVKLNNEFKKYISKKC